MHSSIRISSLSVKASATALYFSYTERTAAGIGFYEYGKAECADDLLRIDPAVAAEEKAPGQRNPEFGYGAFGRDFVEGDHRRGH